MEHKKLKTKKVGVLPLDGFSSLGEVLQESRGCEGSEEDDRSEIWGWRGVRK